MKETAGIRNKNYLNVKQGSQPWAGSVGKDSRGHSIFNSPEYGLRAAIMTLRTYWFKHGLTSVAAILSRWAPSSDTVGSLKGAPPNSPKEYSEFVKKVTGINPTQKLRLFSADRKIEDDEQLFQFLRAMAKFENFGSFEIPRREFDAALDLI